QRNEGEEAARSVLLLPQAQQVIDALLERLDVTIEHGGIRPDPERVGDAVDLAPPSGVGLAVELQEFPEPLREDLGAAARHGAKAGLLQAGERLARLDLEAPPEVVDL